MADNISILIKAILSKTSKAELEQELKQIERNLAPINIKTSGFDNYKKALDEIIHKYKIAEITGDKLVNSFEKVRNFKGGSFWDSLDPKKQEDYMKVLQQAEQLRTKTQTETAQIIKQEKEKTAEIQKQLALYKEQLAIKNQNLKTTYGKSYDSSGMSAILSSANNLNASDFTSVSQLKETTKQLDLQVEKAIAGMRQLRKEATLAMKESDNFVTTLVKDFGKMAAWTIIATALFGTFRQIKEGIGYIAELDNALNEIRIVTYKTQTEVNNLALSYNKLSKEMSVTTKELASEAANLFRQGLNDQQVEERMKAIIQYAKISAISIADSDKIITATANATGESVQKIIDVFALLGDTTASGADEIGEALQRVASAADNSGISLEKASSWFNLRPLVA